MAISVDQLEFQDTDNNWKGIDEIRMIKQNNENNTLFCRTGAGHGVQITETGDVKVSGINWNEQGVPSIDINDIISITKKGILDAVYPVGSVFISTENVNPGSKLGGNWKRISGKFLLGATGDDKTTNANIQKTASVAPGGSGGEVTVKLTAGESGVGSHSHTLSNHTHSLNSHTHSISGHTHSYSKATGANNGGGHSHYVTTYTNLIISVGDGWIYANFNDDYIPDPMDTWHLPYRSGIGDPWIAGIGNKSRATDSPINTTRLITGWGWTESNSGTHSHSLSYSSDSTGGPDSSHQSTGAPNNNATGAPSNNATNDVSKDATSAHNNMPPFLAVYMWERLAD